jgi:hypothetical protein
VESRVKLVKGLWILDCVKDSSGVVESVVVRGKNLALEKSCSKAVQLECECKRAADYANERYLEGRRDAAAARLQGFLNECFQGNRSLALRIRRRAFSCTQQTSSAADMLDFGTERAKKYPAR